MRVERRPAVLILVFAAGLAAGALLACRRSARQAEAEHAGEDRPESLVDPASLLRRLCDPAAVARVSRVTLRGQLDPLGTAPRRPVEERATWPAGWQRRTADAGLAFEIRLDGGLLTVTPPRPDGGSVLLASEARMRRRALFVLRHLAAAVAAGEPPKTVQRAGERLQSLRARDADGEFLLLLGGVSGGLRGIEDGDDAILFQAHAAFGEWFYPSVQSAQRKGSLLEVLRVTRVEPD
jgi:hypothetical protein